MSSNIINQRINFASIKNPMQYPDFLEVQLKSFQDFLQLDTPPEKRKNDGLYKVFAENFPIADTRNNFVLEFLDYYDALAENESAVRELGDDTLRKLAIEVTLKLRQSTTVDWQVRESVRARLRILVRQTLRKYKYPPDKTPGAVELILKQAEVVSNSWTV